MRKVRQTVPYGVCSKSQLFVGKTTSKRRDIKKLIDEESIKVNISKTSSEKNISI